jgi:peptidyl-prolyl cis-trans isomerase D
MSVIQNIRDKYARIAVIAIALALLGFILMDALTGRSSFFRGGSSTTLGRVNGTKINIDDFRKKVKEQEDYYQQQGSPVGEAMREQIISNVWSQEVNQIIMNAENDKLGIRVEAKEIDDILFGKNPPQDLKQRFTDNQTGLYDANQARQEINTIKRRGTAEQKAAFARYINGLEEQRKSEKYNALVNNSANFPKWLIEKRNADNSLLAKISFVRIPYTDSLLNDPSIKVTDAEIAEYINQHKKDFRQEESRSIAYVSFSTLPSAADSAATKAQLLALKPEFDTTTDVKKFFAREGTAIPFNDRFTPEKEITAYKDSILKLPKGGVFGPYADGTNYTIAKMIEGPRKVPDTIKVRHILIATSQTDPQTGQRIPTKDTVAAKKLADSIQTAIKNGANFDSLCVKFSDDPGSKDKGGVYDHVYWGMMVPEFNDFCFFKNVGDKGVVKTDFGYHYMEVLSQKGSTNLYKIAYLAKAIEASRETDDNANNEANRFAGESRDQKSFDENFQKELAPKGMSKLIATDIKPADYNIMGLGSSRQFVRKIYEARKGEVLQPERIGEQYVVAVITEVNKEGTESVAKARDKVEPLIRNKKKAELAKQKFGNITSLESVAAQLGKEVITQDSLRMNAASQIGSLGNEPAVIGAAFNNENKGKTISTAIAGRNGVYAVRVDDLTATAVENADVESQRRMMYQQAKNTPVFPIEILKKAANIKDYRSKFY